MFKKIITTIFASIVILGGATSVFASPFDFEGTARDKTDSTDNPFTLTPIDYTDGVYSILAFRGGGTDGINPLGSFHYIQAGSGVSIVSGNISVTEATIETPEGHLTDTLNGKVSTSTFNALVATVGLLGAPGMFDVSAFMNNKASTSPLIASSTFSGFMASSSFSRLMAVPTSFATVATSGVYSDLTGKPDIGVAFEGTTKRTGAFPIFKSATIASGVAVFNLTTDGTSGGTALCTNGVIQDSVNPFVSDATASYQMSYAFSNSNKTITITTNKLTTSNILTGILGQTAANGSVAKVTVWCY